VCAIAAVAIFSRRAATLGHAVARRLPSERAGRVTTGVVAGLQRYAPERRVLAVVLAASIAVQVLRVLQAYCLGRSLGIPVPVAGYFAFVPIILLVMLLPISINGLGTSQVAFVGLFSRAGVAQGPAFALSVLFLALGIIGNLPGALLYAPSRGERPASR
jgi:glycosyltransferase 2 family protein